jgi:hypothetical protein
MHLFALVALVYNWKMIILNLFKKKHLDRILFPYSPRNLKKLENGWIKDIGAEIVDIKVWIIQFIICQESSWMPFLFSL